MQILHWILRLTENNLYTHSSIHRKNNQTVKWLKNIYLEKFQRVNKMYDSLFLTTWKLRNIGVVGGKKCNYGNVIL